MYPFEDFVHDDQEVVVQGLTTFEVLEKNLHHNSAFCVMNIDRFLQRVERLMSQINEGLKSLWVLQDFLLSVDKIAI